MSEPVRAASRPLAALGLIALGAIVAGVAWLLPASLRSVNPPLLRAAGNYTPSVSSYGKGLVDAQKIGPASLVLAAARAVGDPGAPALGAMLDRAEARQPALAVWGEWDPFLQGIVKPRGANPTPALELFLPGAARTALHAALDNSQSYGVQSLLRLGQVPKTGRFVPANQPGGQPLDALILLSAVLYQEDRMTEPMQEELRQLADTAALRGELGELAPFYLDLLTLSRRLDWGQLGELFRRADDIVAIDAFAHVARVAPGQFAPAYAAALLDDAAAPVGDYLSRYGGGGAADLRLALGDGQGAVRLLLRRQLPVNRRASAAPSLAGALVLAHPEVMLAVKYLGYLLGFFLILRGLDSLIPSPIDSAESAGPAARARAGAFAVLLAAGLILLSEPYLLRAAPASGYTVHLQIPVMLATGPAHLAPLSPKPTMDASTLVSIGVFFALQIAIYLICLRKIAEIDHQEISPLLKLRLMENEENLFDSGLYIGMVGTAAALVLQVLGVIQPNLLAAYSSNLFGIICVALIKIRHVRGYKRLLILQAQTAQAPAPVAS